MVGQDARPGARDGGCQDDLSDTDYQDGETGTRDDARVFLGVHDGLVKQGRHGGVKWRMADDGRRGWRGIGAYLKQRDTPAVGNKGKCFRLIRLRKRI